ncbi:MAG: arginine--tRNA ligase [Candidatus Fibromonas sp.]|jgi:arginyl-tRNA synthetase|nr:arginine--tRNA ligase [Candidatus Fibromonas sp.]
MFSFETQIAELAEQTGHWTKTEALSLLTTPPDPSCGDWSLPCFTLAKKLRKAPKTIAEELAAKFAAPQGFEKTEALNGYWNFYADKKTMIETVLGGIKEKGLKFGFAQPKNKTVVIDYSSPNIGKELAFHHLRSTMLGNCLAKIHKANGYRVERVNHLGDWGTQFGKLIVVYLRENLPTDEQTLSGLTVKELNKLYASFSKISKEEPELESQARDAFAKLEKGDEFYRRLWAAFKEATLKELVRIYKIMGVDFDHYTGESFFEDKIPAVVEELEKKNLLVNSQERDVVLLEELDLPPCLIKKSDGSTLYATRDLAAALYRKKEFDFDKCLYVVDNGQALHFKQVFAVLGKMGYEWSKDCEHIPFGLILHKTEEGKWEKGKTRAGTASLLRDVIEAASAKILDVINEKNPELESKEEIATKIGTGAIVFNDLKNRRLMDVKFDWDAALSFEGATGPYVQNAHVRLCSILRKSGKSTFELAFKSEELSGQSSYDLIKALSRKGEKINAACENREPYILAQYSLELAEAAHRFIHNNRVLGSPEEDSRLFLVYCTQQALESVLDLLGIAPIREM